MADLNINRTQAITVSEALSFLLTYPAGWTFEISLSETLHVFDWGGPYNWVGRYIDDFSGYVARVESSPDTAELSNTKVRASGWAIQSDIKYGGAKALRLVPGGFLDILYAADAGSTQITAYCWYQAGASARMEIRKADGSDEFVTYDEPVGAEETWEQLTCSFTAEKGFYIIRLINKGWDTVSEGGAIVVFDNIE